MTGLREIGTFYDPEEAQVAAGFLAANGFNVILADVGMLMQSPMNRVALGGFRILAPAHELSQAQALLREARDQPNRAAGPCPTCTQTDFRRIKSWWFPAVFFILSGAIVPFATNSNYLECRNCKTRVPRESE